MDHSFFTDIPVFDLMNKKLIELGGEGDGGDVGEGGEVAGSESLTSLPAVAKWVCLIYLSLFLHHLFILTSFLISMLFFCRLNGLMT